MELFINDVTQNTRFQTTKLAYQNFFLEVSRSVRPHHPKHQTSFINNFYEVHHLGSRAVKKRIFFTNSISTGRKNLQSKSSVGKKYTLRTIQDGSDSVTDVRNVVQAFCVTRILNPVQHFVRGLRGHELVAGCVLLGQDVQIIGLRQKLLECLQRLRQRWVRQARNEATIVGCTRKVEQLEYFHFGQRKISYHYYLSKKDYRRLLRM